MSSSSTSQVQCLSQADIITYLDQHFQTCKPSSPNSTNKTIIATVANHFADQFKVHCSFSHLADYDMTVFVAMYRVECDHGLVFLKSEKDAIRADLTSALQGLVDKITNCVSIVKKVAVQPQQ